MDPFEYEQRVRDEAWRLVSREYESYERSGLDPHSQRFIGMKPFWTGFTFEAVETDGSFPTTDLVVHFRDDVHPERRYGFREGIWKVVQWWEEYGPPADMPNDPERLAN